MATHAGERLSYVILCICQPLPEISTRTSRAPNSTENVHSMYFFSLPPPSGSDITQLPDTLDGSDVEPQGAKVIV